MLNIFFIAVIFFLLNYVLVYLESSKVHGFTSPGFCSLSVLNAECVKSVKLSPFFFIQRMYYYYKI